MRGLIFFLYNNLLVFQRELKKCHWYYFQKLTERPTDYIQQIGSYLPLTGAVVIH